ncbi:ABC transporter, permease protein [Aeropyrum pernix K1]|uniref:ABC transporter, permease protein n=1 Tax=Aeropyrum pernix (strain ATCC 700893 / DSM 11879 / JCM 9820 / NBRC 100138 / K1) TaxID=272557 RepID=Q9YFD8_AERPE|nr:ABC transporter permease [Aeropyrum pernix]BAA79258.1 ABC transporter, permease protein [Aeropyrum pernix K1]
MLIKYIIYRFLSAIPTLFGLSILVFILTRLVGDPAAIYIHPDMTPEDVQRVRELYHFDDPLYVQYIYWLKGVLQGDLGYSVTANMPVTEAIKSFLPATLELALYAFTLSIIVGVYLGTKAAANKDKLIDHLTRLLALSGYSMPVFWLALMLLYLFYNVLDFVGPGRLSLEVRFKYMPPYGDFKFYTGLLTIDALLNRNIEVFIDAVKHLIPPVLTQTYIHIAIFIRVLRSSMIEEMNKEYVDFALSKGLRREVVLKDYVRRNSYISLVNVAGLQFVGLMSGVVLTETVFNWPGLGRFAANAAIQLDPAAVVGFTLFVGTLFIVVNLAVDILLAYLDPRIRYE